MSAAGFGAPDPVALAEGAEPTAAERALVRTVAYAAMFQAPLSLDELHRSLMDVPLDRLALQACLDRPFVRERVEVEDGLVYLRGQGHCLPLRRRRREHTRRLLAAHQRALRALVAFPFVRLAAVSGACAHDNATDEDVDVFLVVREGRAWSAYLGLVLLSRCLGVRRTLCLNYVLDESVLALSERDRFTATEIASMRPLAGGPGYRRFLAANAWVAEQYPNFFAGSEAVADRLPKAGAPGWLERVLDLGPAPLLEGLSRRVLGWHLNRKAQGKPGVVLAQGRLKLHTNDHAPRLNTTYVQQLADLGEGTDTQA